LVWQKLSTFIGLGVDPEKDAELGDLLKSSGKYSLSGSHFSSAYVLTKQSGISIDVLRSYKLKLERSTGAIG
jgi:hypothetical protein